MHRLAPSIIPVIADHDGTCSVMIDDRPSARIELGSSGFGACLFSSVERLVDPREQREVVGLDGRV